MAPDNLACRANSCAAPVPVPPPSPVNKITNSTGSINLLTNEEMLLMRCSASGGNDAHPSLSTTVPRRKTWPRSTPEKLSSSASISKISASESQRDQAPFAHEQPIPPTPAIRICDDSISHP